MSDFRVSVLPDTSIITIYSERDYIELDPEYQRTGDVWTLEKRQLLIDSIINGFDIPKIYFHEFVTPKKVRDRVFKFAIIDGKQRLQTIWEFIDGGFKIGDDFELISDPSMKANGLTYRELGEKFPRLKTRFDGKTLSIISIQTDDVELIEEMFSRLNESAPLNAAEKRNAFGGTVPKLIREVAKHKFFTHKLPFENKRYRFLDIAAKFLFLETNGGPIETKKVFLDDFTRNPSHYVQPKDDLAKIAERTQEVLSRMFNVFVNSDRLLRGTGMLSVFYLLFRELGEGVTRSSIEEFEKLREANRKLAESDMVSSKYDLLEFDKFNWVPNDASSIDYRLKIMKKYIFGDLANTPTSPGETA